MHHFPPHNGCCSYVPLLFRLQSEILWLEFERKGPNAEGRITERQLAELLLTYADYTPRRRSAVLKRIKKLFKVRLGAAILFSVKISWMKIREQCEQICEKNKRIFGCNYFAILT